MQEIPITPEILKLLKTIWDYSLMHQTLEKSDVVLILGSRDVGPLYRGVEIFKAGLAEYLVLSGGVICKNPNNSKSQTEAEYYKDLAVSAGVPEGNIIIENQSTNTGDNLLFSKKVLEDLNIPHQKIILVQKPYMERRIFATACAQWLGPQFTVTSEEISMEDYFKKEDVELGKTINTMVGDLQRIKEYPKKGFQIYQEIPGEVWQAYEELVRLGFDKRLIKE
jgi:uncharacterized SAM-binding protein YcdF (DUF218 family)